MDHLPWERKTKKGFAQKCLYELPWQHCFSREETAKRIMSPQNEDLLPRDKNQTTRIRNHRKCAGIPSPSGASHSFPR